ncbi:NAD(P)H-dependent FMN reductase [Natronoarchaeum philippinense]|uniref:NAD(P)H-dependent FMN reductase n=1 Tax=Natronoarchaeum philippinense TaxID=558529 RepID=A0A285N191_NATPI|nr:NAD(P)H-dependent oxidoreductase [Natronoarchaeum philippinense]SNZ03098.1 NAD(P)H-dependent FMN reductase [Natronoarchaeum philippinense]
MDRDVRVVALCGSLRDQSKTRTALAAALASAREAGARTDLLDLREYDLPAYDPDEPEPEDAAALCAAVSDADAVLIGTPNYHGSYSGPLKNALDYCGRDEFGGTTVGLLEVAGGEFPTAPLEHLRSVCRTLNAWTLPIEVAIPSSSSTVEDGAIVDETVAERVAELGDAAAKYAGVEQFPELAEDRRNAFAGAVDD